MTETTVYYLAGQMTGLPQFSYPTFNGIARELRQRGLTVINPAEEFGGDDSLPRSVYLARAIQNVQACDAIITQPNWINSAGSKLEILTAQEFGKPVFLLRGFSGEAILLSQLPAGAVETYPSKDYLNHIGGGTL